MGHWSRFYLSYHSGQQEACKKCIPLSDDICCACRHSESSHDVENKYGEAIMCWCSCPDFVVEATCPDKMDNLDD